MFVMRDGQIRRPQLSDVEEVADRDRRIEQLEQQCAVLAAEVDRMRPVIEAAHHWASGNPPVDRYQRLLWALRTYEASERGEKSK